MTKISTADYPCKLRIWLKLFVAISFSFMEKDREKKPECHFKVMFYTDIHIHTHVNINILTFILLYMERLVPLPIRIIYISLFHYLGSPFG